MKFFYCLRTAYLLKTSDAILYADERNATQGTLTIDILPVSKIVFAKSRICGNTIKNPKSVSSKGGQVHKTFTSARYKIKSQLVAVCLLKISLMDFESLKESLQNKMPEGADVLLQSLFYDAKGDWDKAHDLINDMPGKDAAWVHAYLHRKEGDEANAAYWYNRAGKKFCTLSFTEEWENITKELL